MTETHATELPTVDEPLPSSTDTGWHSLPKAARNLFMFSGLFLGLPFAVGGAVLGGVADVPGGVGLAAVAGLLGAGFGAWVGWRRYRYTQWLLDADGFSLRRGRMWRFETRVPMNRVQHLDLKRGPLERRLGLATLVIHTAGTSNSSVNVGGLPADDAERLRDLLARQAEHDRMERGPEEPGAVPGDVAAQATAD